MLAEEFVSTSELGSSEASADLGRVLPLTLNLESTVYLSYPPLLRHSSV